MVAECLTVAEVAGILSVSMRYAQSLVEDGRLPVVDLNHGVRRANGAPARRLVRVRRSDLDAFLEKARETRKRKR